MDCYYNIDMRIQRQIDMAAEHKAHSERRPRALKYCTDKFYNFPIKHKKIKKK